MLAFSIVTGLTSEVSNNVQVLANVSKSLSQSGTVIIKITVVFCAVFVAVFVCFF